MRWLRWLRRPLFLLGSLLLFGLLAAPAALAVVPQPTLAVQNAQFWALAIGTLVPLVGYLINHFAPWVSEPVKAAVQVALAAVASTVYSAVATGSFGWNTGTAELIISGVLGALVAHKFLWLPSGVSALLGGGSDAAPPPARRRRAARQ